MLPNEISRAQGTKRRRYKLPLGQSKIFVGFVVIIIIALTAGVIYLISRL